MCGDELIQKASTLFENGYSLMQGLNFAETRLLQTSLLNEGADRTVAEPHNEHNTNLKAHIIVQLWITARKAIGFKTFFCKLLLFGLFQYMMAFANRKDQTALPDWQKGQYVPRGRNNGFLLPPN